MSTDLNFKQDILDILISCTLPNEICNIILEYDIRCYDYNAIIMFKLSFWWYNTNTDGDKQKSYKQNIVYNITEKKFYEFGMSYYIGYLDFDFPIKITNDRYSWSINVSGLQPDTHRLSDDGVWTVRYWKGDYRAREDDEIIISYNASLLPSLVHSAIEAKKYFETLAELNQAQQEIDEANAKYNKIKNKLFEIEI